MKGEWWGVEIISFCLVAELFRIASAGISSVAIPLGMNYYLICKVSCDEYIAPNTK